MNLSTKLLAWLMVFDASVCLIAAVVIIWLLLRSDK